MAFSVTADVLRACTSVAASTIVSGSPIDVSGYAGGLCFVRFGRGSATAAGAAALLNIQASLTAAGSDWITLSESVTTFAACTSIGVNGSCASGQPTIPMTSTTGFSVGGDIFVENTTAANSEFGKVISISANTSVTIDRDLLNSQTNSTVRTSADIFRPIRWPEGVMRLRFQHDNSVFTQASFAQVLITKVGI